jgi:ADP-heptose:LPS heptosyltransferase
MPTEPAVVRRGELPTVAGILAQAHVYVGHDSGMTHLAALLDVPTVALFGPTDPERWGPRGRHVTVLRGGTCVCSSWASVGRCHEQSCLAIPAETLLETCRKQLESVPNFQRNPPGPTLSPTPPYAKVTR